MSSMTQSRPGQRGGWISAEVPGVPHYDLKLLSVYRRYLRRRRKRRHFTVGRHDPYQVPDGVVQSSVDGHHSRFLLGCGYGR